TLRKLAVWVDENEISSPATTRAVKATTWCFVMGILMEAISVVGSAGGIVLGMRGFASAMAGGDPDPLADSEIFLTVLQIATVTTTLIGLGVYVWTVRCLEGALYRHLGAE